jgi:hypothetical protein
MIIEAEYSKIWMGIWCRKKNKIILSSILWDMRNLAKNYARKYAHIKGNVRVTIKIRWSYELNQLK